MLRFEKQIIQLFVLFQFLTIHLGQEENDCFSAWVAGKDVGIINPPDQKGT